MYNISKKIMIIALSFSCIGCDQATKTIAKTHLSSGHLFTFINDIIRIQYIENEGGFLGLGNNFPEFIRFWVFIVFTAIALLAGIAYLFTNNNLDKKRIISITFILSGGISNLMDRIVNNGNVVDFLNVGIGYIRTGIFNVADMFIMFGTSYFIFFLFNNREKIKLQPH